MLDNFPNQLTEFSKHLCLLDTAFFVNSSYAPLLRSERKADLIIHLGYSAGSQTKASTALRLTLSLHVATPEGHGISAMASEALVAVTWENVHCQQALRQLSVPQVA